MPDAAVAGAERRRPGLALLITLASQTLAALTQGVPTVLAPAVAPQLGVPAERIGVFVGVVYVLAMFSGLAGGGHVRRFGALRFCQALAVLCAVGLAVLPLAVWPALLLGSVAIGAAYGLANPSAADMLGRHAPPSMRGLIFSIKQTGVPLGFALAGLLAPWLYGLFGWETTVWIIAAAALAFGLLLQPAQPAFAGDRAPRGEAVRVSVVAPLRLVLAQPSLRRLAIASAVYAVTQICLLTFLVSYLHLERGLSLAAAAAVLSGAQLASIAGRPFWGHVADRYVAPAALLGGLGLAMGVTCAALAALPAAPSMPWVYAVCLACAATAIAWNGVFYAELVRVAPRDQLATVTGGTQFMTFLGGVVGPVGFSQAVSSTGSYAFGFAVLAALPALAGAVIVVAHVRGSGAGREQGPGASS